MTPIRYREIQHNVEATDKLHFKSEFVTAAQLKSVEIVFDTPFTGDVSVLNVQTSVTLAKATFAGANTARVIVDTAYIVPGRWVTVDFGDDVTAKVIVCWMEE